MVDQPTPKPIRLNERDLAVFTKHLPCFRITTNEALRRVFRASTVNVVNKWVSRRREQGLLATSPLGGSSGVDCHRLTDLAVSRFGLDPGLSKPPRGQTLVRFYGMLSFCWLGPRPYRKLSREEFKRCFPELVSRKLEQPHYYYIDDEYDSPKHGMKKRLGYLYIDDGKSMKAFLKRLRDIMSQRLLLWPWKPLITERERLLITVVTTDDRKKWQLDMELQAQPRPVPVRVEVREDLELVVSEASRRAPKRQD